MDDSAKNNDSWNWEGDGYTIQKDTDLEGLWDGVSENDDLSYVFDETTPVKACGDLAYHVTYSDDRNKKSEERETQSQAKRRRMLQFTAQDMETSLCSEDLSSRFLKSHNKDVSSPAALPEVSYGIPECSGLSDNMPTSCHENLDHSSEGWIAECLNDADMHCSPEDLNFAGTSDLQIDVSEFCDVTTEFKSNAAIQHHPTRTSRNIIFKGRKSYIRTPTKLASSVAYPFAFIKPCGFHGDVTLKDINQRIRTPPPSKLKHHTEDPSQSYPTSAFSGKPVVGKTKIHTEGGKGSITIMRTRG